MAVVELLNPPAFNVAVITADWFLVMVRANAVNVPDVPCAGTNTATGTLNRELFELKCTVCWLLTLRFNFTVHVLEVPEVSDIGLQVKTETAAEAAVIKVAVCEAPFSVAVIVTLEVVVRAPVVAVNVADEADAGTVTLAGVVSVALLSESVTTVPPDDAAWFSVTVQVLVADGPIVPGLQASVDTRIAGVNVIEVVCVLPFKLAVMVTVWFVVTVPAVALKDTEVAPEATGTDDGTVSSPLLSDRLTVAAASAGWLNVSVQLVDALETIVPGLQ